MVTLTGSTENDTLTGGGLADSMFGGDGNDLLFGGAGNDGLNGGNGNDTLVGGSGADRLDGGAGPDTADFRASNAAVSVNLTTGLGSGGDAAGDTLVGIEAVIGSAYNDSLTGDGGSNTIFGGAGTDTEIGGDGNDTFFGGAGDFIDGSENTGDNDVLDMRGQYNYRIFHDLSDAENGHVNYYDSNGTLTGTMEFRNIETVVTCFTPGTQIATLQGTVAIEALQLGDTVPTRDHGAQVIRWIGTRKLSRAELTRDATLWPVRSSAGAPGQGLPRRYDGVAPAPYTDDRPARRAAVRRG